MDIVAKAAAERNYEIIARALALAERLRKLDPAEELSPTIAKKKRRLSAKKNHKTSKNEDYPKFTVANGSLYKIGWSKKKDAEYLHRVPIERARQIIGALDQLSTRVDGVLSTEGILDSKEFQMIPFPSYQVYLVLALLKREKIVVSAGRDGYRLPDNICEYATSLLGSLEGK